MPASAHSAATREACNSEPPASGSSRSRHARIEMRRRPAVAARSPSLATTSGSVTRYDSSEAGRGSGSLEGTRPDSGLSGPVHGWSRRYAAALGSTDAVGNGENLEDAVKLTGERPMEGAT